MIANPTTLKLVGLQEAMGMALPEAHRPRPATGPSITDTRLPVGFSDDEFDFPDFESEEVADVRPPVQRNRGAWARASTESYPLQRRNASVRSYSVAYYLSEHAMATADAGPTPDAAPRNEHFEAIGYRGRHRWFTG